MPSGLRCLGDVKPPLLQTGTLACGNSQCTMRLRGGSPCNAVCESYAQRRARPCKSRSICGIGEPVPDYGMTQKGRYTASWVDALGHVEEDAWQVLAGGHPFTSYAFLQLLETSGCVGAKTGWHARHLLLHEEGVLVAAAPSYFKTHSRGEFVFDQAWAQAFEAHRDNGIYQPDPVSSGRRALSGLALTMLCLHGVQTNDNTWPHKALLHFTKAGNMTDRFNALSALVQSGHALANEALAIFYKMFASEALVIDKWFALQAGASDRGGHILPIVRQLLLHPDFSIKNPNRARSLIFSYCSANPGAFHRLDAAGYVFWSDRVLEMDALNPQVAARLARALDRWSHLAEPYRSAAKVAIERVAAKPDLSNDVREVVSRALSQ